MTVLILIFLYIAIASACIFGLIVAGEKFYMSEYYEDRSVWVLCGIFWPVAFAPAAAYLAARWYVQNREE